MKRLTCAVVVLAFALLVVQTAAADDSYMVGMQGLGSFMESPIVYSGNFMFGLVGSWEITVDDSMWPDPADSTARFDYIWDTFFAGHYLDVTGAESWTGYFNGATLMATPHFRFDLVSPAGVLEGDITFSILVRDWYADEILSQQEKHDNLNMSSTVSVNPALGQGYFANTCGHGSVSSGNFNFHNPPMKDDLQIVGQLQTYTCPSPVEDSTWGAMKALYR
ncbi:MAG: hypothetical protein ABIK85_10130 [Candidatus Eisenbacteria bacterium]